MTEGGKLDPGEGQPPGGVFHSVDIIARNRSMFSVVKKSVWTTYHACVVFGARTWCASRLRPRLLLHRRCAGARSPSRLPPLAMASRWSAVNASGWVYGRLMSIGLPQRWQGQPLSLVALRSSAARLR